MYMGSCVLYLCFLLSLAPAPYTPEISSETDTSNFEVFDPKPSECAGAPVSSSALAVHLPFVGFSYTYDRYYMFFQYHFYN